MLSSQSSNPVSPIGPQAKSAPAIDRRGIAATVTGRLSESTHFPLRGVWCDYHEGVLCLRGRVPTYYLKQVAQTIACQVDGVEECMNRIEVGPATSASQKAGE